MNSAPRRLLSASVSHEIRTAIEAGEYQPGDRLPSEAELCERFGVSRPTVRVALQELAALGLIRTVRGVGSFAADVSPVRSGLERLESITESIRGVGKVPGMIYGPRTIRLVLPDEAARMGVPAHTEALELRRTVTADGVTVAYSFDLIPMSVFGPDFDVESLEGSMFAFLENTLGVRIVTALAEVHAVESDRIGWGPEAHRHRLFVLLDQVHLDADENPVMYSRSYFVEGAYSFVVIRRRDGDLR